METTRIADATFAPPIIFALLVAGVCGPAQASDDSSRTPAEWLVVIENQSKAEKDAWDSHWLDVMRGAALALEPYEGRPEVTAKYTGEKKRLYAAYRRVWDEHGHAVADKLLAGESLGRDEQKYRFLASGTLLHRYLRRGIKKKEKTK